MTTTDTRVAFVGGSALTRDLFTHVLHEAGIDVLEGPVPMPVDTGVALVISEDEEPAKMLNELSHRATVLVADIDPNDESVAQLVLDGADAVINFQASASELSEAVRLVARGGTVVAPRPARRLSELARAQHLTGPGDERLLLTNREIDILQSIGRGEAVKETAQSLGISVKTVENLQSRLFRKLDVRNRAQAFAQAHTLGLLPTEARSLVTDHQ